MCVNEQVLSHPVKEVPMKYTSPLILVQFLKKSILEAFTAMVLIKAPTPMPSQAGEKNVFFQVGGLR